MFRSPLTVSFRGKKRKKKERTQKTNFVGLKCLISKRVTDEINFKPKEKREREKKNLLAKRKLVLRF